DDLIRIVADRADRQWLERYDLARFQDAKRVRRLEAFLPATGAGALAAQMRPRIFAAMAVVPFDDKTVLAFFLQRERTQRGHAHGDTSMPKGSTMIIARRDGIYEEYRPGSKPGNKSSGQK